MKYFILFLIIISAISCEDERLHKNTFALRKATSEKEVFEKEKTIVPGQVVSVQLEYINQDIEFCFGWFYDTGSLGIDEFNIEFVETYEFNYRLDPNATEISVKLLNENDNVIFELNQTNLEFKGNINAGTYKLQIINPIEWIFPDSSLVPVFIQPDYQYLNSFGNEVLTDNYLERDVYQLISVGKCEYCDLKNAEEGIMNQQFLREVSFRGADMRNSNFSNSIMPHSIFSSFIPNTTTDFTYGHTNLNNAKLRYCNLDSSDISDTYDMNNADFYFSTLYRAIFSNSIGKYVNFESCIISSSTFENVDFSDSFFIGAIGDSTHANNSKIIDTDMTYGIFTNSFYNNVIFTGSRLDYARFDSVSAFGSDFCLISRVSANFDSLKVDENTLCNPNYKEENKEEDK